MLAKTRMCAHNYVPTFTRTHRQRGLSGAPIRSADNILSKVAEGANLASAAAQPPTPEPRKSVAGGDALTPARE